MCTRTKDIYNSEGKYVKTVCKVEARQSFSVAKRNCEQNSMKLADSSEYLNELKSFTGSFTTAANIWVGGNGCTLLTATDSSKMDNYACYPEFMSICEYNKLSSPVIPSTRRKF